MWECEKRFLALLMLEENGFWKPRKQWFGFVLFWVFFLPRSRKACSLASLVCAVLPHEQFIKPSINCKEP